MKASVTQIVYSWIATVLLIPALLRGVFVRSWRHTLSERMCGGDWLKLAEDDSREVVWLHAASVGEVGGLVSIVSALRRDFPDIKVFVSTTSVTGKREALVRGLCENPCLLPFDHPWILDRAMRKIKPKVFVLAETELWPGLLITLERRGVPVLLVNGRVSDFSFPLYHRARVLLSPILKSLYRVCVQTEQDAKRFSDLGVEREKIEVVGSTKYDREVESFSAEQLRSFSDGFGLDRQKPCFVAGSVRPQEDASVIAAYISARAIIPELQMIIAPRHPERFQAVAELLNRYNIEFSRRSNSHYLQKTQVVLLDTIGELSRVYALADCSFVGGTLVNYGGHNPLEPAAYKSAIIVGPYTSNVRDAIVELRKHRGVFEVETSAALADVIVQCVRDQELRMLYGEIAHRVWKGNLGATKKIHRSLTTLLLDYERARRELRFGVNGTSSVVIK